MASPMMTPVRVQDVPEPFAEEKKKKAQPPRPENADAENAGATREGGGRGYYGTTMQQVRQHVNTRLSSLGRMLSDRVMSATDVVGDKIGDIARETSGECDRPTTDDDIANYVPQDRLAYINGLRSSQPATFEKVAAYAVKFASDDFEGDRNKESVKKVKKMLAGGDD